MINTHNAQYHTLVR